MVDSCDRRSTGGQRRQCSGLLLNSVTYRRRQLCITIAAPMLLAAACSHAPSGGAIQKPKPLPKLVPLQVDYNAPPRTWREALDRADVVAVVQLKSSNYEQDKPRTHFIADITELIKRPDHVSIGPSIPIMRNGGVLEVRGVLGIVEEANFEPWTVGQTLLVFLKWFDQLKTYSLPFGPDAAFELNPITKKVGVFANTSFASRHKGRDVAAVLAELKAAR